MESRPKIDFFAELPVEVSLQFLAYLSPKELASIMLVCQHSTQLANDTSLWRAILKQYFNSSYSPQEHGKDVVKRVVEFSKQEDAVLAEIAKNNLENAKLILQTPQLADKLIDAKDLEMIGVAHEEAARIILQTPKLVEKIIGEPRQNAFSAKPLLQVHISFESLAVLANIIVAHESLAREFLSSKESTTDALKSWINPDVRFYCGERLAIHGYTSDEKPMAAFANYFTDILKIGIVDDSLLQKPNYHPENIHACYEAVQDYDTDPEIWLSSIGACKIEQHVLSAGQQGFWSSHAAKDGDNEDHSARDLPKPGKQ